MNKFANPNWTVLISFQPVANLLPKMANANYPIVYIVSNKTALTAIATAIQPQPSDILVKN